MKRRSRDEILADILKVAKAGVNKTHIVYKANLNFRIVKGYLSYLLEVGLIENENPGRIWRTTERGLHYLEEYRDLRMEFGL